MTLQEYQLWVSEKCAQLKTKEDDLLHMISGLITETSEIIDPLKKQLAYKKELDMVNIKEELGDGLFYIAGLANVENLSLEGFTVMKLGLQDSIHDQLFTFLRHTLEIYYAPVRKGRIEYLLNLWVNIIQKFGFTLDEIVESNQLKLNARYKEKFTTTEALNRDLETERKILEQ
jgi:NTP pyrophosphatase (non-canonical NTP hydrolase)